MLVLSRKPGQGIWIGNDVRIHVVALKNGQVRLGIEAPVEIRVMRDELLSDGAPPLSHSEAARVEGSVNRKQERS